MAGSNRPINRLTSTRASFSNTPAAWVSMAARLPVSSPTSIRCNDRGGKTPVFRMGPTSPSPFFTPFLMG